MVVQNEKSPDLLNLSRRDFGLSLLAALVVPQLPKESLHKQNTIQSPEEVFSKACHKLIEVLEDNLNISFSDKSVTVAFRIPEHYLNNPAKFTANYNIESNEIVFHPHFRQVNISKLLEDPTAKCYPEVLDSDSRTSNQDLNLIREIIAHELGHYFMAMLFKNKLPDSWIAARYQNKEPIGIEDLGLVIVQEGIGECFGSVVCEKPDYFASSSWEAKWDEEELRDASNWNYLTYQGGFSLIKPLIQQYGQSALEYLAIHPLYFNLPSLKAAKEYQQTAFQKLKEVNQK